MSNFSRCTGGFGIVLAIAGLVNLWTGSDPVNRQITKAVSRNAGSERALGEADAPVTGRAEPVGGAVKSGRGDAFSREAEELAASPEWVALRAEFYRRWGARDAVAALEHALSRNPGASTACVGQVISAWAEVDRMKALAWVKARERGAEKSAWMQVLVEHWPADRLAELSRRLEPVVLSPGAMGPLKSYAARLVGSDPAAAFLWISEEFSEGKDRRKMISTVMRDWAIRDSEAASGWLAAGDGSMDWRDDAIEGLVLAVAGIDAEAARGWAEAIGDADRRSEILGKLAAR